jgi:hypothetical protein
VELAVAYICCRLCHKQFYITGDLHDRIQQNKHDYLICPWCKEKFRLNMDCRRKLAGKA